MQSHRQQIYKTYIFQHHNNIMFFHYNVNHPIMTKNITFELGNVNIFVGKQYYTCKITSKPCLAPNEDWSYEFFAKLFHGLALFEVVCYEKEEGDYRMVLEIKDHFVEDYVFLLRANLNHEFSADCTAKFWSVFQAFSNEKIKCLKALQDYNTELQLKAKAHLQSLQNFQYRKQKYKYHLKGKLSALLRYKEAKLNYFGETFVYPDYKEHREPQCRIIDEYPKMQGSLFQASQQFAFH